MLGFAVPLPCLRLGRRNQKEQERKNNTTDFDLTEKYTLKNNM